SLPVFEVIGRGLAAPPTLSSSSARGQLLLSLVSLVTKWKPKAMPDSWARDGLASIPHHVDGIKRGGELICYEKPRSLNFGVASSVTEEDYSFACLADGLY